MDFVAFMTGDHDFLLGMHLDSDTCLRLDDLDFTRLENGQCCYRDRAEALIRSEAGREFLRTVRAS